MIADLCRLVQLASLIRSAPPVYVPADYLQDEVVQELRDIASEIEVIARRLEKEAVG